MKKIFSLALAAVTMAACTGDFDELNQDPNLISEISPGTLLNPIIYDAASQNANQAYSVTFNLMQVSLPYPSVSGGLHRYDVSPNIGNTAWNGYYRILANIREMRTAAETAQDNNYLAVALTLNAWVYSNLTDVFGPVPMTEAVRGEEGIYYPAYDSQQHIYETILQDLETANTLYNTSQVMPYASDILYANNVAKWQKFTNSLRMRLLLRVSGRPETNAWATLTQMVNNPTVYPVFTSNADAAILNVTGVAPLVSPWSRPQDFRLGVKLASFFVDNLNSTNDPRRPIIGTQATDLGTPPQNIGYVGIPSGYAGPDSQFQYEASTFNITQVTNPMKIFIMSYAEVEFIKAELAQRGYITGADTYYTNGVTAAIQHMGGTVPEGFFDDEDAAYNGTLERIMLQKYYALYFTDYQQWSEYRRTGLPQLPTTTAMQNGAVMPARFTYPVDQNTFNNANYLEGIQLLGGQDNINTHVWWDVD
ncbi:hypothetical protein AM493_05275 [Flavobacterium akiainvivens]|uniref:SusD/RagB family nutrient-binding outer membrane lipoprotein n=1 Tax=Flavobacterium akiainvivens TaxID=1202724 RepID=A0A0M8MGV4_9FLAO|nr:SusD/RagB family nutrient-binding outer membrane lipoprotein [Flavobacterium akiainvivens]KOS05507.1 hypothetical protein AM493_05275 [Flavobacterium akiainvivens]SFQ33313.1 Starch-binding associating with outer membrane [Flavobacterium akiainvivens]